MEPNIYQFLENTTEVNPPVTLGFKPESDASGHLKTLDIKPSTSPNLTTSDPNGMGLLIGKPANELSPQPDLSKDKKETKDESFSFF